METLFHRGISPEERLGYLDLLRREYHWDHVSEQTLGVYQRT
ncbi:Alpha-D-GlcNAc alpha-1,2-L-rhamnosyltransferase [Thermosulfurimonas dismutans]|uniref:Alpha-D-GlcNAc alpha-1,2-L-rhamnosyltransferase n=1 Tax=Thermosulfurimonas dismutans TaxID=999894 RepID=A0A179D292_9BACT|nr:Alpha-D-GlcNAc alpha-1,2-L-rhamnosyltransferase [Thermosulfurimonas dismutans]